ncbi:MAG: circularly permuted type 2 ATP-grasp protein [Lentisphaeraceae bacterium]|nr:circularly permuted type 2 ATP-grasp protein [Lentisphaeraceae bacterium]
MSKENFSLSNLSQLSSLYPGSNFEFLSQSREIEPVWQMLFEKLKHQEQHLSSFPGYLNKLLTDSGVTFNLYEEKFSVSRPWHLDPIPLVYSENQWNKLSAGLQQRAQAWDCFLKDIYGEKRIIKERIIPDEIVYNNKSYLRPCQNLGFEDSFGIFNYSADVVRDQLGEFKVVGDKAQNPFGIGYTLENRLALSRIYESTFKDCKVKRLASFFKTFSESIQLEGIKLEANPKIVVLTPGPYNEGFYEHNLLSRYLGYTLARGSDLIVRNGMVYLKTIEGLKRVHVILRRQLDTFCDPLELKADSVLGIPGLVQSIRLKNVKVINNLGSGIVNDQIFLHFYEKICRFYLGATPKVTSANTYWFKHREAIELFQQKPENYLVYEILQGANKKIDINTISDEEFSILLSKIQQSPEKFMAIENLETKKVPIYIDNKFEMASYKLRTFLCKNKDGFNTLDGALCLAAIKENPCSISIQSAQISKDTWILSNHEVPYISLLKNSGTDLKVQRKSSDMPSSVIDNLLWLARYMERTESTLRVMNYIYNSLMNETGYDFELLKKLYYCICEEKNGPIENEQQLEAKLITLQTEETNEDSLCFLLHRAIENASVSRSRISADTWKLLAGLKNIVLHQYRYLNRSEASLFISKVMNHISAFNGLCYENMTREAGWRFLDTGKRIERIDQLCRTIKVLLGCFDDEEQEINALKVILEVADCSMTYNSRYLMSLQIIPALDLLIADDTNPRSIFFQLQRLSEHFNELPGNRQYPRNAEQQIISQALNDFNQIEFSDFIKLDQLNNRPVLIAYLNKLQNHMDKLSASINRTYLSHLYETAEITYSEK